MITAQQETGYQTIIVEHLFGLPFSTASSVASSLQLPNTTTNNIRKYMFLSIVVTSKINFFLLFFL